jgi:hypothetical protein
LGITGPSRFGETTVDSFTRNLPELLGALILDERDLICIAELTNGQYIQFRVSTRTTIIEVVSNQFLRDANALSPEDEDLLRSLGFSEPSSSWLPNWRLQVANSRWILETMGIANLAIVLSLHASQNDMVKINTFEAPG